MQVTIMRKVRRSWINMTVVVDVESQVILAEDVRSQETME